jgi:hypothetical protein
MATPTSKPTTITEYNAALAGPLQDVAERLTALIDAGTTAGERSLEGKLWQAQPVWMQGRTPVIGFKAFPRWVTLMIWNRDGSPAVSDASGTLEAGPRMATRKFASAADLDNDLIASWVQQIGD